MIHCPFNGNISITPRVIISKFPCCLFLHFILEPFLDFLSSVATFSSFPFCFPSYILKFYIYMISAITHGETGSWFLWQNMLVCRTCHIMWGTLVECLEFDQSVKRRLVVMQVLNSFDSLLKTVKFPSLSCCCCCSYCSGKFIIICWNIGQKFISEQFTY